MVTERRAWPQRQDVATGKAAIKCDLGFWEELFPNELLEQDEPLTGRSLCGRVVEEVKEVDGGRILAGSLCGLGWVQTKTTARTKELHKDWDSRLNGGVVGRCR